MTRTARTLSETYDAVIAEVRRVDDLRRSLLRRGRWAQKLAGLLYVNLLPGLGRRMNLPELSSRATREEWRDPLLDVIAAPYFFDALATHLREKFDLTPKEAGALLAIHGEWETQAQQRHALIGGRGIRAAALAVAAFFATELPKDSFESLGLTGNAYGIYRFVIFVALIYVIAYAYAPLLPLRILARKDTSGQLQLGWGRVGRMTRIALLLLSLEDDSTPTTAPAVS